MDLAPATTTITLPPYWAWQQPTLLKLWAQHLGGVRRAYQIPNVDQEHMDCCQGWVLLTICLHCIKTHVSWAHCLLHPSWCTLSDEKRTWTISHDIPQCSAYMFTRSIGNNWDSKWHAYVWISIRFTLGYTFLFF